MKTVILSIQRENNRNIESGAKTLELRTLPPTCELPFRVLTYESGPGGRHAVTNEWICDKREKWTTPPSEDVIEAACVSRDYVRKYTKQCQKPLYTLHISKLKVYDEPKKLSCFRHPCKHLKDGLCVGGTPALCRFCGFYFVKTPEGAPFLSVDKACFNDITRPPQNFCYAEKVSWEIGEKENDTP